jgi:predicted GIY-YIG superfamily endonuclease
MSRSKPSWLATVLGSVYTLHFWPPYGDPEVQQAKHYTGWAQEGRLNRRLTDHYFSRGARLTQVQRQAGGSWVVADVEHGVTIDRETQLKERSAARRCSVCKASRDIAAGRITKTEALTQWPDASPAERSMLREIFGMDPEPAPEIRNPVPVREIVLAPRPAAVEEITPEMDALVDTLCEGWLRDKAEARAQAGAEAGPERARELRSEPLAAVPAPRPAPEPQTQSEVTPQITAPIQDRAPQPEAEAEPEPEPEPELELEAG